MKGIILNLVEEAVVAEHGETAWDRVLDAAALEGAWTSTGDHADAHLARPTSRACTTAPTTAPRVPPSRRRAEPWT